MLYFEVENKQEIHLLSSGTEQGLPRGDLWVFSTVSYLDKEMFHIISQGAISSQQLGTVQSTQTLLQDTLPRAQGSALWCSDIRNNSTDQRESSHWHFCSHHNMQPGNFIPSPTSFPWTTLKHTAGSLLVNQ